MTEPAGPPRYKRGRELAGLSIGQASRMIGIERTRLTDIEALRVMPDHQEVLAMADAYGTSEAWLDGAAAIVPEETRKMLRDADLNPTEREDLIELIGSVGTRSGK